MDKILIADDDRLVLEQLSELIGSYGYEVSFVSKSDYILKRIRSENFNLLLLDVFMPGTTGMDILRELRSDRNYDHIPVIMITGEGDEKVLAECFSLGATDFIDKPINETILHSRLKATMRSVKTREELIGKNIAMQLQETELQKQRSIQYRLQSLCAQMNPHFIFNSINAIQYFILEEKKEKLFEYLSQLSSLFRQALSNSKQNYISLEEEIDFLEKYLNIESQRLKGKFSYQIIIDEALEVSDILIPPMLIQPYVENAILHGILPKQHDGEVRIEFAQFHKNLMICTIEDNGVGIEQSLLMKNQQQKKTHKSVGMSITQTRLELLNSLSNNAFSVNTKSNTERHASGTIVTIHLPLINY